MICPMKNDSKLRPMIDAITHPPPGAVDPLGGSSEAKLRRGSSGSMETDDETREGEVVTPAAAGPAAVDDEEEDNAGLPLVRSASA